MSPHRERVVRGNVASEHIVHLFDEQRSLVETVAGYLCDGWRRGDRLLVAARAENWTPIATELAAAGCPVEELAAGGQLLALDAGKTLASFTVEGEPDREAFNRQVGDHVRRLCRESAAGLTAYGEMVDILAEQGNLIAAERLESFWNDLSTECSLRLLCGYSAKPFGDGLHARHLDRICLLHADGGRDTNPSASWLLADRRPRYQAGIP